MGSQIPRTRPGAYLALLLALMAGQAAQAEGLNLRPETWGEDWTREDTYRQAALTALLVVDWGQTKEAARKNEDQTYCGYNGGSCTPSYREVGFARYFIGEHPSVRQVNNYFALSILGHAAISYVLQSEWRKGWQYVLIGIEIDVVRIGLKMEF
jgi:hypothetical protein